MKHILTALSCLVTTLSHAIDEKYTPEEQASIDKQYEKAMKDWNNEALRRDAQGAFLLSTPFTDDQNIINAITKRYQKMDFKEIQEMNMRIRSLNELADEFSVFSLYVACRRLGGYAQMLRINIENYLVHGPDYANAEEGWKNARKEFA